MHPLHEAMDLSAARRVLVCGDVHGRLDRLVEALSEQDFNGEAGDVLICLGDWLDRGPAVLEIRDWILSQPEGSVRWVRGNHEEMALQGAENPQSTAAEMHIRNGGIWMINHLDENRRPSREVVSFLEMLNNAPVAITARTPGGANIGIVHADACAYQWDRFVEMLGDPETAEYAEKAALWSRERITRAEKNGIVHIMGLDHAFFGHSIVSEPRTIDNCTWIDTGAFKENGCLTVLDVDRFLQGKVA